MSYPHVATSGRVVVTGTSGRLGPAVVKHLAQHGWDVVAADVAAPTQPLPAKVVKVDLTDFGQVVELLTGFDECPPVTAVVHLAAIPAPGLRPDAVTFANNMTAAYNVYRAARIAGIRNVVSASSETTLGLPFDVPPPYVPIDEDYAVIPQTTYSLGKALEEDMARHLVRWDPTLKFISLRFSNVMLPEDYAGFEAWQDDAKLRRWNLWSYIDARDGAQAVRKALELDATGWDAFIIANADNAMRRDSADLVAKEFPNVPVKRPIVGRETLLSIDKARRVLGYNPEFAWQDQL
ncbi:MAG: NAD(P)-dependent oxidoreductase [Cellulomonadaceae bacterium]|jgi:nucleoside-diphosphate-sugar epimerase|nr:NAD(P)-dependent oxidoreductase [Cellulomonadaceae bacterium]